MRPRWPFLVGFGVALFMLILGAELMVKASTKWQMASSVCVALVGLLVGLVFLGGSARVGR